MKTTGRITIRASRSGYRVSVRTGQPQIMSDGARWDGLETVGEFAAIDGARGAVAVLKAERGAL